MLSISSHTSAERIPPVVNFKALPWSNLKSLATAAALAGVASMVYSRFCAALMVVMYIVFNSMSSAPNSNLDSMPNRYIIYAMFDPHSGQLRYVGKSCSGLKRPKAQLNRSLKGYEKGHKANWLKSLAASGAQPCIEVIQTFGEPKVLEKAEKYWIAYFKAMGCPLTNLTDGGDGQWGVKFTEERKLKIAKAHGARPFLDENGNRYESVRQAARALDTYHNMISQILLGKRKTIHGHTFRYVEQ